MTSYVGLNECSNEYWNPSNIRNGRMSTSCSVGSNNQALTFGEDIRNDSDFAGFIVTHAALTNVISFTNITKNGINICSASSTLYKATLPTSTTLNKLVTVTSLLLGHNIARTSLMPTTLHEILLPTSTTLNQPASQLLRHNIARTSLMPTTFHETLLPTSTTPNKLTTVTSQLLNHNITLTFLMPTTLHEILLPTSATPNQPASQLLHHNITRTSLTPTSTSMYQRLKPTLTPFVNSPSYSIAANSTVLPFVSSSGANNLNNMIVVIENNVIKQVSAEIQLCCMCYTYCMFAMISNCIVCLFMLSMKQHIILSKLFSGVVTK